MKRSSKSVVDVNARCAQPAEHFDLVTGFDKRISQEDRVSSRAGYNWRWQIFGNEQYSHWITSNQRDSSASTACIFVRGAREGKLRTDPKLTI